MRVGIQWGVRKGLVHVYASVPTVVPPERRQAVAAALTDWNSDTTMPGYTLRMVNGQWGVGCQISLMNNPDGSLFRDIIETAITACRNSIALAAPRLD